jgi:hypothetical protein
MEQIDEAQRAIGDAREHLERIAMVDADIGDAGLRRVAMHMDQRLRDAVEERLAADEAMIGQHVGALRHMLAAAEADLEMQRARLAEQALGGDRAFVGTAICGSRYRPAC